jgi:hypothetical protein
LNCFLRPHYRIKFEKDTRKNRFGQECFLPMKASSGLVQPEAMHLVRRTIEYFDRSEEELNDTQVRALEQINLWKDTRIADVLGKHECIDFDRLISERKMRQLLRWINELFSAATARDFISVGGKTSMARAQQGIRPPFATLSKCDRGSNMRMDV